MIKNIMLFVFTCCFFNMNAQQIHVTGKVSDKSGPIPGVNIVIKGTPNGVQTDLDGQFFIEAEKDQILVFNSVGLKTQEYKIKDSSPISIMMVEDVNELEEIVVVGYGVQRKSDVTGAISKISAKEVLANPNFNALEGMKGKVSGVNVFSNSGSPTGQTRVIIRGVATINSSSNPLYVVDGVAVQDFNYLNPNDIESMEVLKDASSTAIYGARGANGVILVTTKRGTKNSKITVGFDSYISIGRMAKKIDLLDSNDFMQILRTGYANAPKYQDYPSGGAPVFTSNDPLLFDANGNPLYNTDWQKEATRTAISKNHQLSIQQGDEKSQVGLFLNYSDNEGILLNSYAKRVNAKLTYDVKAKDWLSLGANILVNKTSENDIVEGGGEQVARRTMLEMPSIFPVKFPDGSWSDTSMGASDGYGLEFMNNPVNQLLNEYRKRVRTQILGNIYLTFHLGDGLDLKTQYGVDRIDRKYTEFIPKTLAVSDNGRAIIYDENKNYWQEETYLTYTTSIGTNHRINGMFGMSWQGETYTNFGVEATNISDDFFKANNLGAYKVPSPPTSNTESWTLNSYFLRGGYTYKDKYLVTATARLDGSSRFGKNNKYGFFPSLGLGWTISKEDFFKDIETVNLLKLRTSYGITGNTEINPYSSLATIESGTNLLDGTRVSTAGVSGLANPDLEWEKTAQFDIGLELGLFNRRLNVELDYYYKLTSDLLLDKPVPNSSGYNSILSNIGSVSNKGIDLTINTTNIQTDKFTWETSFLLNYNQNKIESLGANNEDIFPGPWWVSGSQTILRVGESLSSFYGFDRYGTYSTADAAANPGVIAGVAKRSEEKRILGKGLPDFTGSFNNKLIYGNFDFNIDVQFVEGVENLNQTMHSLSDRTGIAGGLRTELTAAWTEQNQNTKQQQIRNAHLNGQDSEIDSFWVNDGSYVRINAISLGYNVPKEILDKFSINRLRFYSTMNNVWVFTTKKFQGYDPEGSTNTGNWAQNMFFFQYPKPRTITFGLNLSF